MSVGLRNSWRRLRDTHMAPHIASVDVAAFSECSMSARMSVGKVTLILGTKAAIAAIKVATSIKQQEPGSMWLSIEEWTSVDIAVRKQDSSACSLIAVFLFIAILCAAAWVRRPNGTSNNNNRNNESHLYWFYMETSNLSL